jgi:hypothetical protein
MNYISLCCVNHKLAQAHTPAWRGRLFTLFYGPITSLMRKGMRITPENAAKCRAR